MASRTRLPYLKRSRLARPEQWIDLVSNCRRANTCDVFKVASYLERTNSYWPESSEKMHDLTGFQRDLLYVIAGLEEPHGLAIKSELQSYYEKEINHGRLYPNLDTLVDKGLVEKGKQDRRTNIYSITGRGNRELEARNEWERQYLDEERLLA